MYGGVGLDPCQHPAYESRQNCDRCGYDPHSSENPSASGRGSIHNRLEGCSQRAQSHQERHSSLTRSQYLDNRLRCREDRYIVFPVLKGIRTNSGGGTLENQACVPTSVAQGCGADTVLVSSARAERHV